MTNTADKRIGLLCIYDTRGITVKLHAPGCGMLKTTTNRRHLIATGAITAENLEDWAERSFLVVVCKCAKPLIK